MYNLDLEELWFYSSLEEPVWGGPPNMFQKSLKIET